jgi:hypothetical protein
MFATTKPTNDLRLSGGHADAPRLTPAEIDRLGAEFVRDLLAGWEVPNA